MAVALSACTVRGRTTVTDATGGTTTATAAVTTTTMADATAGFVSCMRDAGVEIGDVPVDAVGQVSLDAVTAAVDVGDPAVVDALGTCSVILTSSGALDLRSDPEVREMLFEDLRLFSECMRDQGLMAFPDPDPDFDGSASPYPVDRLPLDAPDFDSARTRCESLIGLTGITG